MTKSNEITGTAIRFNETNLNGRRYDISNFLNYASENLDKRIDEDSLLGELGHPSYMDIGLNNASHKITNIRVSKAKLPRKSKKTFISCNGREAYQQWRKENSSLITTAKFLDTNVGDIAKSLKDNLVLSPRGTGTVDATGVVHIKEIHTFDLIDIQDSSFHAKTNSQKV